MLDTIIEPTKVAILAASADHCQQLQTMLEKFGLQVVAIEAEGDKFLEQIKNTSAEVLFIDIGDSEDQDDDIIGEITEHTELPILFNDSGPEGVNLAASSDVWAQKLAQKLVKMAKGSEAVVVEKPPEDLPHPMVKEQVVALKKKIAAQIGAANAESALELGTTDTGGFDDEFNFELNIDQPGDSSEEPSELNVWVLGASLGGPQAVRQFLSTLSPDLPIAFILAQHIGANHINLLAEQLNRVTPFTVLPGKSGHRLRHKEVILTPADKQISFTEDGYIALQPSPPAAVYSPSIDLVMTEVAEKFGNKAGTIIFSGMGDDGAKGCEAIAEHGGVVWAQDIASCVVSSMPDQARKTGKVSYSANPEELAKHLYEFYGANA